MDLIAYNMKIGNLLFDASLDRKMQTLYLIFD